MSTTDGPRVPGRTGRGTFLPVAGSTISSFLSDISELPCNLRGTWVKGELREVYTPAQRNQGNGGAKTHAVACRYSTTLNSAPGFGSLFGYSALISSSVSFLNLSSGMSAA